MRGPEIIARTLSVPAVVDKDGRLWQYHSRSDQHSKVACWAVLFDLLEQSSLLRAHVADGKVAFGINRQINDWRTGRKKDLDLVVARTPTGNADPLPAFDLTALAARYKIVLDEQEKAALAALPTAPTGAAGSTVLVALEAKACMTAHVRALPRLFAELTDSYATVHGDNGNALAVGFVMVNIADSFVSPGRQHGWGEQETVTRHRQPQDAARTVDKMREIHRRPGPHTGEDGFDALGVLLVEMRNDGSPVRVVDTPPAPGPADALRYERMISRAAHLYDAAFGSI